jgi:hypothetical protein
MPGIAMLGGRIGWRNRGGFAALHKPLTGE